MIIIIERISKKTDKQDLIDFIQPALKGYIFQKAGRLGYVKVVRYKDKLTEKVKYYGLILVTVDSAAERVIKRSNKKLLLGHRVTVRKYHLRSWHNDPRVNNDVLRDKAKNMRKGDRRHGVLEEIRKPTLTFTGQKHFFRSNL